MFSVAAASLFTALILHISVEASGNRVQGRISRICALKGLSVDLPCIAQNYTSNMTWYTVHMVGSDLVQRNICEHGNCSRYSTENYTLTIHDLQENDTNYYCCGATEDNTGRCWVYRTELSVTDLQVKVIPATEGQTVSLMCSTSCPLTVNPAAYIWYKNREFLYQDWSPWYQELVTSDEAVTYSCAVKGYEDLRAPEVSVDSVTTTCFNVTYVNSTPGDGPRSFTYPTELKIKRTYVDEHYRRLTCTPSCPLGDPHAAYRWYYWKGLYKRSERQTLTVPRGHRYSCSLKGHEYLHSPEVCPDNEYCLSVNYVRRRICALERSSVKISCEYVLRNYDKPKAWYMVKPGREHDPEELTEHGGRLEMYFDLKNHHFLNIQNLRKNDSADYLFTFHGQYDSRWKKPNTPRVTLVVTGLTVEFSPSAVVPEDQRVRLTCRTSCPLTENTNYIWYLNGLLLTGPEEQNKHLVLDPVRSHHAGKYSCAVKSQRDIKSPEKTLTVQVSAMTIINAVRLALVLLILIPLLLVEMWIRCT